MGKKPAKGEHAEPQPRTLCWCCRRSFLNGCSWAESGIPVEGWKAIENCIVVGCGGNKERPIESYTVLECPLFKDDSPNGDIGDRVYHAKRIEDTKGAEDLAAAIIKVAVEDYIDYFGLFIKLRDETSLAKARLIERWIKSKDFAVISKIDPDWLIEMMRQKTRRMAQKKARTDK